jgi:hypothetical protein
MGHAPVGLRVEYLAAFELHRFVQERLHRLGHALEALLNQQFQQLVEATSRVGAGLGLEVDAVTWWVMGVSPWGCDNSQ